MRFRKCLEGKNTDGLKFGLTRFDFLATAANGWHAVKVGSQVGWVSGKYSEIATE